MPADSARPYFLWDEPTTEAQLRTLLAGPDGPRRDQVFGKMLREARDLDVWTYATPEEVARMLPRVERRVGRRMAFWTFLIEGWRMDGLLDA